MKIILLLFVTSSLIFSAAAQPSVPVDLLTGRAQISIPIWEVQYGSISAPVGLSYNSSGVRPQDPDGIVGMNWSLIAGGAITREMRGLPDDYFGTSDPTDLRRGWLHNNTAQTISNYTITANDNLGLADCSDENYDWTFLNGLGYNTDTEPDIFSFNAPGLSGQFVFGIDKLPKLIPYQDLKIIITPTPITSQLTSFVIIKNDGTKYTFGMITKVTRQAVNYSPKKIRQFIREREIFRKPIEYRSSWLLTKIEGPNGESIDFDYGTGQGKNAASKKELMIFNSADTVTDKHYKILDYVTYYDLQYIQSPATKITFQYMGGGQSLTKIVIQDRLLNNQKEFELKYLSIRNINDGYGTHAKNFLREIQERNPNCESFPAYKFEYYNRDTLSNANTMELPFNKENKGQDHWGYYNQWDINSKPVIYYYASRTNAERYRYYPLSGVTAQDTIYGGSNRNVNPNTIHYGSLQSITYPTGGRVTLTYEPNDYHDVEANISNYGPGIRVKQVKLQDRVGNAPQTVIDYEYKTTDNKSSGKWVYRSVFAYHDVTKFYAVRNDLSPGPSILYERATFKQTGKGKTVYEYILPGMYPLTTQADYADWSSPKVKVARYTSTNCVSVGQLQIGYYLNPFAPNANYDFERGLISKISDYSETGSLVHEKVYTYQRLASPTIQVNGIRYERLINSSPSTTTPNDSTLFVYTKYPILTGIGKVVLTEKERTADMTDLTKFWENTVTYTFSSTHYMLNFISQVNSDNVTTKKRFTYAKDFAGITSPASTDSVARALKTLNDENRHGTTIETINSIINGTTETFNGASMIVYKYFGTRTLPKEVRVYNGTTGFNSASFSPTTGANQTISASSYRPSSYIENYDSLGNPLTVRDLSKSKSAFHYGFKNTLPIAAIKNASSDQVVYAGFETFSNGSFNINPAGATYPAGRTGRKGIQVAANSTFEKTVVRKGIGNSYRVSAWVYATSATNIIFKINNGTSDLATTTLAYGAGDVNQWKYLEGVLTPSTPPASFKVIVTNTVAATLDDILFYPSSASVNTYTYEPLIGKTSETDTRGVSSFIEYDVLGRLKYIKDQDKTLRQISDYYYKIQPYPSLNANFYADKAPYQVVVGTPVNYSAPSNCASPVTYDWYVNGVKLGNGVANFSYTFNATGKYAVKMIAIHPTLGTAESIVDYDVKVAGSGAIGVSITSNDGNFSYSYCNGPYTKTFTAALTGCYVLEDVSFEWFYDKGAGWVPAGGSQTFVFDAISIFNGYPNIGPYSVKCVVTTTCPTNNTTSSAESVRSITYDGNTKCN